MLNFTTLKTPAEITDVTLSSTEWMRPEHNGFVLQSKSITDQSPKAPLSPT